MDRKLLVLVTCVVVAVACRIVGSVWPAEPPQAPKLEVVEEPLTYKDARRLALKEGKPLVVFVRQAVRPVPGCIVARLDNYEEDAPVMVIVGTAINGELYEARRLKGVPSDAEIKAAVNLGLRGASGGQPHNVVGEPAIGRAATFVPRFAPVGRSVGRNC